MARKEYTSWLEKRVVDDIEGKKTEVVEKSPEREKQQEKQPVKAVKKAPLKSVKEDLSAKKTLEEKNDSGATSKPAKPARNTPKDSEKQASGFDYENCKKTAITLKPTLAKYVKRKAVSLDMSMQDYLNKIFHEAMAPEKYKTREDAEKIYDICSQRDFYSGGKERLTVNILNDVVALEKEMTKAVGTKPVILHNYIIEEEMAKDIGNNIS